MIAEFTIFAVVRLGEDEHATTYRSNGSGFIAVWAREVIPGRKIGCKGGLLDNFECDIGLWELLVPKVVMERWANTSQYGYELGLVGMVGWLGDILKVDIWGYELVVRRTLFSDDTVICSAVFIFKNLEVDHVAVSLKVFHNLLVGSDAMTITLIL